jgi:hypothetical protein
MRSTQFDEPSRAGALHDGADPDDSDVGALAAAHDSLEVTAHRVSTECRRAQWYGFEAREAECMHASLACLMLYEDYVWVSLGT